MDGTAAVPPPVFPRHTDWLHHRLVVSGPATVLAAFRNAAAGPGTVPWQLDLDSLEEDWFHLLASPADRELSLAGARLLSGRLRDAVERRHALAASRVGRSRACSLDLHALVPVPPEVLRLGPGHPDALFWLWRHWGTGDALRHVTVQEDGTVLRLSFWSADWTPWPAFARVRADWPALGFDLRPDYAAG